jgi:hypothetical protein
MKCNNATPDPITGVSPLFTWIFLLVFMATFLVMLDPNNREIYEILNRVPLHWNE